MSNSRRKVHKGGKEKGKEKKTKWTTKWLPGGPEKACRRVMIHWGSLWCNVCGKEKGRKVTKWPGTKVWKSMVSHSISLPHNSVAGSILGGKYFQCPSSVLTIKQDAKCFHYNMNRTFKQAWKSRKMLDAFYEVFTFFVFIIYLLFIKYRDIY